jgi:hypothetical protein
MHQSFAPRSLRAGFAAAAGMAAFYVGVVWFASGSSRHLGDQVRGDWYLLVLVIAGFALQVALLTELHHRHRLHGGAVAAGGAGAGASGVGMVACCAHHLADLLPFVGAAGAATFLSDYRLAFVAVGVGVNAVGITIAARRLRALPAVAAAVEPAEVTSCAA